MVIEEKQLKNNTLIINDFRFFKETIKECQKAEDILSLACALAVNICKKTNANSMELSSNMTGLNSDDFISGDVQIIVKNIKYKIKDK